MCAAHRFAEHLAEDLSPADYRHVMVLLQEELARLTQAMDIAARAGDATTFRRVAHGIAGSAGAVGAEELEQAARLGMTRPADGPAMLDMAADVRRHADSVLVQIEGVLNGGDGQ